MIFCPKRRKALTSLREAAKELPHVGAEGRFVFKDGGLEVLRMNRDDQWRAVVYLAREAGGMRGVTARLGDFPAQEYWRTMAYELEHLAIELAALKFPENP